MGATLLLINSFGTQSTVKVPGMRVRAKLVKNSIKNSSSLVFIILSAAMPSAQS